MVSFESPHSSLIPSHSDNLYSESSDEKLVLPATIIHIPNDNRAACIPSSSNERKEVKRMTKTKRKSAILTMMADVSRRLRQRKIVHGKLCKVNDLMCILGLFGVFLMIIENEIRFTHIFENHVKIRWIIKITITIMTMVLVGLVIVYHYFDMTFHSIKNGTEHWRFELTNRRIVVILIEVFVCLIHPFPRSIPFYSNNDYYRHYPKIKSLLKSTHMSHIDIDIALSLLMFARLYLLFRFILFRSSLVRDASSQSLGYLNQVSIDFFFLTKTYLAQWPAGCLLLFCSLLFCIGSWSLRACNYTKTSEHWSLLDSMWLFIVTFTTVGYGDLTPTSYCGRIVTAMIALVGVLSTALFISVLSQKLELTRSEKYVHNFVLRIELVNQIKSQAANIVKFSIWAWHLKRKNHHLSNGYITAKRKVRQSIYLIRSAKQEQKKLLDNCIGLQELMIAQRETNDRTEKNTEDLSIMKSKLDQMNINFVDVNQKMTNIESMLNVLVNRTLQNEQ